MKANVNKDRNHAYVLKIENIKAIWSLLQERIGKTTIIVKCKDDIEREFDDLKTFQIFENSKNKAIKHLIIRSICIDSSKFANIEFSDSLWRTVNIHIEASENVVRRLNDDINDIIDGIKPWYSKVAKIDFIPVLLGILAILLMSYGKTLPETSKSILTFQEAFFSFSIVIIFFLLIIFIIYLINILKKRYFPVAYFAIGQGLNRFDLDEKVRWGVIVAFIVSVSASIVLL